MGRAARILLLTATIRPPGGVPGLIRVDPQDREADYLQTLQQLAPLVPQGCFDRIVFAENSAADLSALQQVAASADLSDRIDFHSFYGLDYPPIRGKAYGEFLLIQHAMEHVPALRDLRPSDTVWKLTGRYRITNFPRFLSSAPGRFDFYCDLKDRPRPWADFRTFAFTRAGYEKYFLPMIPIVAGNSERFIGEEAARPFLEQFVGQPGFYPRFRTEPLVQGLRGHDGRDYADLRARYKFLIRALTRRLAPALWI